MRAAVFCCTMRNVIKWKRESNRILSGKLCGDDSGKTHMAEPGKGYIMVENRKNGRWQGGLTALLCMLTICLTVCLAGCGGDNGKRDGAIRRVTDATGATVEYPERPVRVASLSASTDEILLDLLPPERIVAVTRLADDPGISNVVEKAAKIPNKIRQVTAENMVELKPDLMIMPDFTKPEVIQTMRDMGLATYVYRTQKNYADVRAEIITIGSLVGEPEKAEQLVAEMDAKLERIRRQVGDVPLEKRPRVLFMRANGVYYNKESSFRDVCHAAGGVEATEVLDSRNLPPGTLSKEMVVELDPDVIALGDWNYDGKHDVRDEIRQIREDPAYRNVKAVRNNRIHVIPSTHLLGLSHYMAEGSVDLAGILYPDRVR